MKFVFFVFTAGGRLENKDDEVILQEGEWKRRKKGKRKKA